MIVRFNLTIVPISNDLKNNNFLTELFCAFYSIFVLIYQVPLAKLDLLERLVQLGLLVAQEPLEFREHQDQLDPLDLSVLLETWVQLGRLVMPEQQEQWVCTAKNSYTC